MSSNPTKPAPAELEPTEVRLMHPAEAEGLSKVPPFSEVGLPDLGHAQVILVQGVNTGAIYGYWMIFDTVHVEPLWVHPSYRRNPGIIRRLWNGVRAVLRAHRVPIAFGIIADADLAANEKLATRIGFRRLPGQLFCVEVPATAEVDGKKGD